MQKSVPEHITPKVNAAANLTRQQAVDASIKALADRPFVQKQAQHLRDYLEAKALKDIAATRANVQGPTPAPKPDGPMQIPPTPADLERAKQIKEHNDAVAKAAAEAQAKEKAAQAFPLEKVQSWASRDPQQQQARDATRETFNDAAKNGHV